MISSIFDYLIGTRWKLLAINFVRSFKKQNKVLFTFRKKPNQAATHQRKASQVPRKLKRSSTTKLKTTFSKARANSPISKDRGGQKEKVALNVKLPTARFCDLKNILSMS